MSDPMCADCAGFDIEWMYRCDRHKTQFCRGCACPECAEEEADEAWDDYEENIQSLDLEDQLEYLLKEQK